MGRSFVGGGGQDMESAEFSIEALQILSFFLRTTQTSANSTS